MVEGTVESKPGARRLLHQLFEVWVRLRPARVTLGVYSSRHGHRSDHIVVFVVTDWRVEEPASPEIAEVAFFAPDELPPGTTPGSSRRISDWMTGVPPATAGNTRSRRDWGADDSLRRSVIQPCPQDKPNFWRFFSGIRAMADSSWSTRC